MSIIWGTKRSQQRRGDLELQELLRPRAWEKRNNALQRGIANGLLIATPLWLAFGRLMGWW